MDRFKLPYKVLNIKLAFTYETLCNRPITVPDDAKEAYIAPNHRSVYVKTAQEKLKLENQDKVHGGSKILKLTFRAKCCWIYSPKPK